MSMFKRLFNAKVVFTKIEDCLLDDNGLRVVDVHKMIRENVTPKTPPCLLITAKHWFFFERQYFIHSTLWSDTGRVIRMKKNNIIISYPIIYPDHSPFYRKILVCVRDYSAKMMKEIKERTQKDLTEAKIINLSDYKGK